MSDVLRLYRENEAGPDGYPAAWHESIKHLVRELAGHRCVRCGHPYVCGQQSPEWSRCDRECRHAGPIRAQPIGGGWVEYEDDDAGVLVTLAGTVAVEARWRVLTVHHLTGDKLDCRWWNLAALCQRCHLTIQGKVVMERRWLYEHAAWFRPYVAGYYAWLYRGEELTREQAEARVDELLALEHRQESLL